MKNQPLQSHEDYEREFLSAIVKGSDDAIISKDLNTIITSWNNSAERIFGYTAEEAVGKSITILLPEERIDEEDEILNRIKRGERVDSFETKRKRKDGTLIDVSLTISPIKDAEDNIVGASKIARDITKRKYAEQQLRKSRNRLRAAFNIDTVGVLFWGGEGEELTITEVNNAFLKMSGFSQEEVLGKSWRELTPEEFYSDSEKAIADLEATGRTEPYEKQYIRRDGSRWWGLFAPRRIDEKEAVEFVLDITDRKEAQKKLEEMNETLEARVEKRTKKLRSYQRQLRSLASQLNRIEEKERQRLATELHDSLGQLLIVAKMRLEGLHGQSSRQTSSALEEVKKVIDDALTYNQNLMVELKPPPVLNKEDVTEVLKWTVEKMKNHGLQIQFEDDGQLKPVEKEIRSVLHQSVREALQNIANHAETNKARVELARKKGYIQVIVEDKGKGFDVDSTQRLPADEHGFGLFNIKERMDWHGGKFDIHSEPGKGTKVVLQAPLKEGVTEYNAYAIDQKAPPDKKKDQSEQTRKVKILLADDHKMVRRGLRQMIEKEEDIQIVGEASDGKEAVELARETNPDILIMDVNMPIMDGIEATRKIKDEMPHIRIIGLSLHESREVIENMQSAGASAYLTKNEAFESLVMTIRAEASAGNHI